MQLASGLPWQPRWALRSRRQRRHDRGEPAAARASSGENIPLQTTGDGYARHHLCLADPFGAGRMPPWVHAQQARQVCIFGWPHPGDCASFAAGAATRSTAACWCWSACCSTRTRSPSRSRWVLSSRHEGVAVVGMLALRATLHVAGAEGTHALNAAGLRCGCAAGGLQVYARFRLS